MRLNASASRKKRVLGISAVFLLFVLGAYTAVFASIHAGVTDAVRSARRQNPGDRVRALSARVDCEACGLAERNRAVWALGQLRDPRALPVLKKYDTNRECNHSSDLCQYEIRKSIKAVESKYPLWLGYRDFALR
jgi:hypothetical protein